MEAKDEITRDLGRLLEYDEVITEELLNKLRF
jgi:hypothetical protein